MNLSQAGVLTTENNSKYTYYDSKDPSGKGRVTFNDISTTGTLLSVSRDKETAIDLPFTFDFYGTSFTRINVAENGGIIFGNPNASVGPNNSNLPASRLANSIFAFWDDLTGGQIRYKDEGNRFIVQWSKFAHQELLDSSITFQVVLHKGSNNIDFVYEDVIFGDSSLDNGADASIGLNKGTDSALKYSVNETSLNGVTSIRFLTQPRLNSNTLTVSEGQTVTLTPNNFSATSIDNSDPSRITYIISNLQNGQFLLNEVSVTQFTEKDINDAKVEFVHNGGEAPPSFNIEITDGSNTTDAQPVGITFTNVNDNPTLTDLVTSATFNENIINAAAGIIDNSVTLNDVDSPNFNGGNLTVTYSSGGGLEDQLSISSGGSITLNGKNVSFDGVVIGSVDISNHGGNGKSLVVNFTSSNATLAAVKALIENLTYQNTSDTPSASRTISVTVNNGDGGSSTAAATIINVTADNDKPVNNVSEVPSINEDETLTFRGSNLISINDPDAGSTSVSVTISATDGTLNLSGINGLSFTEGDGTDDGFLELTGSVADINQALNGMTFKPRANYNGAASVQITTEDLGNSGIGGNLVDSDTVEIAVKAVNDAPVNTVPQGQSIGEDGNLVFKSTTGNAISISDVDANEGTGDVKVTLSVTKGELILGQTTELTLLQGDKSATITLTGKVANINNALEGLTYRGNENFDGVDTLVITTQDLGNTGIFSELSKTDTVPITVEGFSIPEFGAATPYPSSITMSGLIGNVATVQVTLNNLSHTYPDDIDILLVGPNEQNVLLMSDAGGNSDINDVTLTFANSASAQLPDADRIVSGTYKPTNYDTGDDTSDTFQSPAPSGPYATTLSVFNGTDPNGTWTLYATDDADKDVGNIASGWSLNITTINMAIVASSGALSYTENAGAVVIDSSATASAPFSSNFDTGTLTVHFTANGSSDDRLAIQNQGTGAGQIGVFGSNVTYEGTVIGTFTGGNSDLEPLVITFNSSANASVAEALIQSITYANVSEDPSTNARTVSFVLTDGNGGISTAATKTINVTAVNDAPVLVNNSDIPVNEGSTVTISSSMLQVSDVDNSPNQITYTLTTLPTQGVLQLNSTALAVNGTFTQDEINNNRVTYVHDGSETTSDGFSFTFSDDPATFSKSISVTAVNDAPTVANAIADQSVTEDAPFSFQFAANTFEDPEGDVSLSYSATLDDGSLLPKWLNFDATTRTFSGTPINSNVGTLSIKVQATDTNGAGYSDTFDLAIANTNDAPTDIALSSTSINEYSPVGTPIGNLSTSDIDDSDTHTYQFKLDNNSLSDISGPFQIVGSQLQVNGPLDYQTQSSYTLTIRTTDVQGAFFDQTFTIAINNLINIVNGTDANETFVTTNQPDAIDAAGGNDTITTTFTNLQPNDTLKGGNGADTFVLTSGNTSDALSINLSNPNQLSSINSKSLPDLSLTNFENVELSNFAGSANITGNSQANALTGSSGNDTLDGGAGADTLTGGFGNDTLIGGTGNDVLVVDSTLDVVTENFNQGVDTVQSSVTLTLGVNIENLTLTGTAAINGTGSSYHNNIIGNAVNNTLSGMAGNDTLSGGVGNDTLTGGAGADRFSFNTPTEGADTLTDFVVVDDTIFISATGFGGGLTSNTAIAATQLYSSAGATTATNSSQRFIYNTTNGALFFDADGNGTGAAALQIATLPGTPAITNADIFVTT